MSKRLEKLGAEWEKLKTFANKFNKDNVEPVGSLTPELLDKWGQRLKVEAPAWGEAMEVARVVVPTSAMVERFFSFLNKAIGPQSARAMEDLRSSAVSARFNFASRAELNGKVKQLEKSQEKDESTEPGEAVMPQ